MDDRVALGTGFLWGTTLLLGHRFSLLPERFESCTGLCDVRDQDRTVQIASQEQQAEICLVSGSQDIRLGNSATFRVGIEVLAMTKKEIANKISTDMGIPQTVALRAVRRTFESIITALDTEGKIELRDFAMFKVVTRKGRNGRNPRTGERVAVPARTTVKFTPGREMTKRVREAIPVNALESSLATRLEGSVAKHLQSDSSAGN